MRQGGAPLGGAGSRLVRPVAALLFAIFISFLLQAWWARPIPIPDSEVHHIQSLSFNPVGRWGNPEAGWYASPQEVESAIKLLKPLTNRVRIYTVDHGLHVVPEVASRYDMKVTLGTWVTNRDPDRTRREIELAVDLARRFPATVDRIFVGNEAVLTDDAAAAEIVSLMDEVRSRTGLPVSTGEPSGIWKDHPSLARHADFIATHILPYWAGEDARTTLDRTFREYRDLQATFPDKHIEIAEFGWPSGRFNYADAYATPWNQAMLIRRFIVEANRQGVSYNIIEAFDQPWKTSEGAVGDAWGIYNAWGGAKFPLVGPVSPDPVWLTRAVAGSLIGILIASIWLFTRSRLHEMLAVSFIGQLVGWGLAYSMEGPLIQYWTPGFMASWVVSVPLVTLLCAACFERFREAADCLFRKNRNSLDCLGDDNTAMNAAPLAGSFVSIHVPACREKPEILRACLDALARLHWSQFEVIVVINNTPDVSLYQYTTDICREKGPHFSCVYAPVLPGFKSGALNLALKHTSATAQYIALVDADYVVEPDWLTRALPLFSAEKTAAVQFPQEHFADLRNPIRNAMNDEYAAFFDAGMVQRDHDNALVLHGTMLVLRRSALEVVGGWHESHICEDTELGLRLLTHGYELRYSSHRAGRGVLPDDMIAFRRQRDRWVYGGMRIAAAYARDLFALKKTRLTILQRHHFLFGWVPWLGDAVALLAGIASVLWAWFLVLVRLGEPPNEALSLTVLAASFVGILHAWFLHGFRVRRGILSALGATLVGLSLQTVVGRAVFRGLFRPGMPFRVTAKGGSQNQITTRLRDASWEIALSALQVLTVIVLMFTNASAQIFAIYLLAATIAVQAIPNVAAVVLSVFEGSHFLSKGDCHDERGAKLPNKLTQDLPKHA